MKAVITNKDEITLVELPLSRMNLAAALADIGIQTSAEYLYCSYAESDSVRIKLFGESTIEHAIAALATSAESLATVNTAIDLYQSLPPMQQKTFLTDILGDPTVGLSDFCRKAMKYQQKHNSETYYFPLTVTLLRYNKYGDLDDSDERELDGRFAGTYADEIEEQFNRYIADEDMAEYFDGSNSAIAKIKSLKWGFENRNGVLYGKVDAVLTESLTKSEENELKEYIEGQNSDGFGEGFEQQNIEIHEGVLNVHFWTNEYSYQVYNKNEFDEMLISKRS